MLSSVAFDPDLHDVTDFHSGESNLDEWLKHHAAGSDDRRITRTFVWTELGAVIGFYALMATELIRDELPKSIGRGSPQRVPAILLARLAVDMNYQGGGNGGGLLGDAMERSAITAANLGARFLVVDALHEDAVSFYEYHGFRRIPDSLRLVQKLSSIVDAIETANLS